MENAQATERLKDFYLTGVRPNGKDLGVGAYGTVFEVDYCGSVFAAKEIHTIKYKACDKRNLKQRR